MKLQTTHLHKRRAFTLIELMVVILILAILAALIVPKIIGRAGDAKIAKAKSDLASLSNALDTYRLDNGSYPSSEEGLQALINQPSGASGWKGPYVKAALDPWGAPYEYEYPGTNGPNTFVIRTYGSDGAPGGEPGTEAGDLSEGEQQ
ncbi:type II secretion system protein GspG [bacterium]|nr:MAG: type II secretion system protein GspG [bacterium]